MAFENNGFLIKSVFWTLILAGFAFTAVCFAYTYGTSARVDTVAVKLTDEMVKNDRIREANDRAIVCEVQAKVDIVNSRVSEKLDKMQHDITELKVMLARITK